MGKISKTSIMCDLLLGGGKILTSGIDEVILKSKREINVAFKHKGPVTWTGMQEWKVGIVDKSRNTPSPPLRSYDLQNQ